MDYVIAAIIVLTILAIAVIALIMLMTAVAFVGLTGAGVAWLAWRYLPVGRRASRLSSRSPLERLTDSYVSGHMDIGEFEQSLSQVLARR